MLMEGKRWFEFMISVAMACTAGKQGRKCLEAGDAAAFIRDILCVALSPNVRRVQVEVIPYPAASKIPLLLTLDEALPRLFWYYPEQSTEKMCERLADFLEELTCEVIPLATA